MTELQPFLKGTPRRYRDADVYRTTQTDSTSLALMNGDADGSTLLLGDEKSVLAAIVRRGGALAPPSGLLLHAQTLASTHNFWLIAEGPLSGFQPSGIAASNPLASKMAAQMKGIDMGLAMHDGFQFELGIAAESEAVAVQMTQLLSAQIQMALMAQVSRPELAAFANKVHISAEGNRMQIRLALTKDEFEQQLKAAQAARMQASTTSQAARPSKPGHITIYGLDDGPRVIQTTH